MSCAHLRRSLASRDSRANESRFVACLDRTSQAKQPARQTTHTKGSFIGNGASVGIKNSIHLPLPLQLEKTLFHLLHCEKGTNHVSLDDFWKVSSSGQAESIVCSESTATGERCGARSDDAALCNWSFFWTRSSSKATTL